MIRAYNRNFPQKWNHPSRVLALRVKLRTHGLIFFLSVSSDKSSKGIGGTPSQDKGFCSVLASDPGLAGKVIPVQPLTRLGMSV